MPTPAPPVIFSPPRRLAARKRMQRLQRLADAPKFLIDDMVEDVLDRLAFLRFEPKRALIVGHGTDALGKPLERQGASVRSLDIDALDEERPYPEAGFDFIASLGTLDTVNDLPGALVHIRNALAPSGLAIVSFPAAGSLPMLRAAMLAADGDRAAPRLHPQVDVRAGGQLLQRAGFSDPVIDCRSLDVGYRSFDRLIADLRAQGLSNVLARSGPPLGKAALKRARSTFAAAGEGGRTVERFEILTLSGWRR